MDECFESMDGKGKCLCATISSIVVLLISVLIFSFGAIEPTEYGILYNSISKEIDTERVYEGGLQFIGLFNHIYAYPRIQMTVEFSDRKDAQQPPLQARTQEGLELSLHFAFAYQIQKDNIPKLYRLVEQGYENLYEKIARNTILLKAGDFTAPQYWQNRTYVGNEMLAELNKQLQGAYADCVGFMFLRIDLPDSYENAIVQTQVVNQQRNTQEAIMNQTLIRTQIEVDRSAAKMQIDVINAEAESRAMMIANNATQTTVNNTITYQTLAYANAKTNIALTDSQSLLDYIFYLNIINLNSKDTGTKLIVGLDSPIINMQASK